MVRRWLVAAASVGTGLVPRTRRRQADQPRQPVTQLPASVLGGPRLVRDQHDPTELGVHVATATGDGPAAVPPYVCRDVDDELRAALGRSGLVVVVGNAMAGKSRTAFEVMRATLPDHVLALPVDADALVRVTPTVARQRRCVVWLDDLDRYVVGERGLTVQLLARLLGDGSGHIVVLATMHRRTPGRCLHARQCGANAAPRDVWHQLAPPIPGATEINVGRRWSDAELRRAEAASDHPLIANALRSAVDGFGVAESLTAGPAMLGIVRDAWADGANPRGAALVTAAVDCRRAGLSGPVPVEVLAELHEYYLARRDGRRGRPESWEAAVRFATAPVGDGPALLADAGDGALAAHDYLVDAMTAAAVPDRTWRVLIDRHIGSEAYELGVAAMDASRFEHALAAFTRANGEVGDARVQRALAVGESGHPDRAVQALEEVLAERKRRLGTGHPDVLAVRHDLACWRGETGDAAGAVAALRKLAPQVRRAFGPDDLRTLAVRHDLACWRGETGDAAGAVTALRKLAAEAQPRLGTDHPDLLAIRHDLACWQGRAADVTGAVGALETWLVDGGPRFGPGHPRVLAVRHDLARLRGTAGGPVEAAAALADLLDDQARFLAPEHPAMLATRHDLALLRGAAGDAAGAATALRDLLGDVLRIHGPEHPHTLAARHNLAHLRATSGDVTAAVAELDQVHTDRMRILGTNHPGTLATGHAITAWQGLSGDPSAAVVALERALVDQVRVLGATHASTLAARHNLARLRGEAGDLAGAVAGLQDLRTDLERRYGPDHRATLVVRHELACHRAELGDLAGARLDLAEVLADQVRILGPDHPDTLAIRHNLAYLRGAAGDAVAAEAELALLLPDQVRVLGLEHPGTDATRHNLDHLRRERQAARLVHRILRRLGASASTDSHESTHYR